MEIKSITTTILDEGYVIQTNGAEGPVATIACTEAGDVLNRLAAILNVDNAVSTPETETRVEVEGGENEDPLVPVTSENREEALAFLAENGVEVKPRTKNNTLTKMIAAVRAKPEGGESSEPTGEEKTAGEEGTVKVELKEPAGTVCPMCQGTKVLCPSSETPIDCSFCDGTGVSEDELSSQALRNMGNRVLNTAEKGSVQHKALLSALQSGIKDAGYASLGDVTDDGVAKVCESVLSSLDKAFSPAKEEKDDEEW